MKILIIAYSYPPINSSAASRPYAWAKYWQKAGHEVFVITIKKTDTIGHLHYYTPLHGVEVVEINVGRHNTGYVSREDDRTAGSVANRISTKTRFRCEVNHLREAIMPSQVFNKLGWVYPAVTFANDLYHRWQYETIVSTFDPFASHIIANRIKKNKKVFWVADYRDLLNGNPFQSQNRLVRVFDKTVEKLFLHSADLLTTVSEPLAAQLKDGLNKPVATIENGFDPDDYVEPVAPAFPADHVKHIVYMGKIYPTKRDPEILFQVLGNMVAKLRRINLELRFYTQQKDYLATIVEKYQIGDIVKILDFVDRRTAIQIECQADFLLFLDWNDPDQKGILTGKLFEYLYANKPIISIGGHACSDANRIIKETKSGMVLENSENKIHVTLEAIIAGTTRPFQPDRVAISQFNRKNSSKRLLHIINDCMAHGQQMTYK